MTPAKDQGQDGTKGTTGTTTARTGGMEASTPAMGATTSTADPAAGGNRIDVNDTKTRIGPDASESSAATQSASSAGSIGGTGSAAGSAGGGETGGQDRFAKVRQEADKLRGQATDRARSAAEEGKKRATDTIDGLAQAVHDAAGNLEQQVGPQVAHYAHRAADALDSFSAKLRNKSVDELVDDASDFARRSPAIAIGAAVALGFALSRFLKATSSSTGMSRSRYGYDEDEDLPSLTTTRTTGSNQPRYNA